MDTTSFGCLSSSPSSASARRALINLPKSDLSALDSLQISARVFSPFIKRTALVLTLFFATSLRSDALSRPSRFSSSGPAITRRRSRISFSNSVCSFINKLIQSVWMMSILSECGENILAEHYLLMHLPVVLRTLRGSMIPHPDAHPPLHAGIKRFLWKSWE